jgi:hypothetical protein
MKAVILTIAVLSTTSVFAQYLKCGPTNRFGYESFGLGIDAQMTGSSYSYSWLDHDCFALGQSRAALLVHEQRCPEDYKKGYANGKAASGDIDSACFNLGYSAGISALDVGARVGDSRLASVSCINSYRSGFKVGASGDVGNPPFSGPTMHCYQLGYNDGTSTYHP